MARIMVLADGETYTEAKGSLLLEVSHDELEDYEIKEYRRLRPAGQ